MSSYTNLSPQPTIYSTVALWFGVTAGVTYWNMSRAQGRLHDLAWGFDLVLTTFSRLGADWAADSPNSPSKQVTTLL